MIQLKKYRLSYTAGSLLLNETIKVANFYSDLSDWAKVKEFAQDENVTNSRTASATKRFVSEIITRLKSLKEEEIQLLVHSINIETQKQIVWISICKTYDFIAEFMEEVIHNKLSKLDFKFDDYDYDRFFLTKLQWHAELDNLSDTSKYKVKQVLLKMLKQMDFMNQTGDINQVNISNEIITLYEDRTELFKWFPSY